MENRNFIAERTLIAEAKNTGERKDIVIKIGVPYWDQENTIAFCPRYWSDIFPDITPAPGVDLIQALQYALDIDSLLKTKLDEYSFYWQDGSDYF